MWNISLEVSYPKYFGTSRNFCFLELVVVCHSTSIQEKTPTLVMPQLFISHLQLSFFLYIYLPDSVSVRAGLVRVGRQEKPLATGAEDLVFTKNHLPRSND